MAYGYIAAIEIVVSADDIAKCLRDASEGYELNELIPEHDITREANATDDWYVTQEGHLKVERGETQHARVTDLENIEAIFRLQYLANLDTGEYDQPALCNMDKTQVWADQHFRFIYRLRGASLMTESTDVQELAQEHAAQVRALMQRNEDQRDQIGELTNEASGLAGEIEININEIAELRAETQRLRSREVQLMAHLATVADAVLAAESSLDGSDEPIDPEYARNVLVNFRNLISG